jgi:hypothetical protein
MAENLVDRKRPIRSRESQIYCDNLTPKLTTSNVPPYVAGHPALWDTLTNFYYNEVNNDREAQVVSG